MTTKWTLLKSIIAGFEKQNELFLTLLDEDGNILCANARMIRSLKLKDPRRDRINFFQLLHPANKEIFRDALQNSAVTGKPLITELYLKNGFYHPMKWQLVCLEQKGKKRKEFFCTGYNLADKDRLEKFTQIGRSNYQQIVETLGEGVLLQDLNGELISANQRTAEIFDTTLERLYELRDIEKNWDSVWEITDENGYKVPFSETPFIKAAQTGQLCTQVLYVKLKNGSFRKLRFISQMLFDETEPINGAVISGISDISNEEQLSDQLKERETLFNAFMRSTPNLAWVIDENAVLVNASNSFYKYFGLNSNEAQGQKVTDLVPPEVSDALFEKHLKVLETGKYLETTEKVKWADGSGLAFHVSLFPIEGMGGKKLLGGHAVNVAEKYAVEKQLRETNERLLLFSRASSNAIREWDMQTGYIFRNDHLMDMIGYPQEETRGLTWWLRRIHPEDRNRVSDTVKEVTDSGKQSWEQEYRFKCADGTYKHMLDKGFIVYENSLPVRMIGSLQDITNIRTLQDELVQEKLSHQKELSETVIRVQEKERTRIGLELHDNVNQILSTTKLFVDLINPVTEEEIELKKKSIDYLLLAIDEIRKLSRELVTPRLNSKTLVESIQQLIDDVQLSGAIKIRFVHDHDVEMMSPGKRITIFRIVQEQVKNILKYSNAPEADILLHCRNNILELVIKDNGVGFDPSKTRKGIGLSNISQRVEFYDGDARVESAPGKGCMLKVNLPLKD